SIWRNETRDKGSFYSTTFARTYRDEKGDVRDTHSFSGADLLRLSELSREAYSRSRELRREHAKQHGREAEDADEGESREEFESRGSETKKREPARARDRR